MSDPAGLADDHIPVCPYCGCGRHDSEWLHDGNRMETQALVDAMLNAFLRDPGEPRPAGIRHQPFPEDFKPDLIPHFRAKMEAALGTAIRNMPYLAALRAQTPERDAGERMREACIKACEDRISYLEHPGRDMGTCMGYGRDELRSAISEIRSLSLATEGKR